MEVVFKLKRRIGYHIFHTYLPTVLIGMRRVMFALPASRGSRYNFVLLYVCSHHVVDLVLDQAGSRAW